MGRTATLAPSSNTPDLPTLVPCARPHRPAPPASRSGVNVPQCPQMSPSSGEMIPRTRRPGNVTSEMHETPSDKASPCGRAMRRTAADSGLTGRRHRPRAPLSLSPVCGETERGPGRMKLKTSRSGSSSKTQEAGHGHENSPQNPLNSMYFGQLFTRNEMCNRSAFYS